MLLLRKQTDSEQDIDEEDLSEEAPEEEEEKLYCAKCGRLITKGTWRISMSGGHEHTFFNPSGMIFKLFCFKEAPGVRGQGAPSSEFTWFKGYKWQVVHCASCSKQMGWRFMGSRAPRVFFALIQSKLINRKPE